MKPMRGKYRIRTWVRQRLPWSLLWLAPRGKKDCGNHHWCRWDDTTWRCLHCDAGITHTSPWSPIDTAVGNLKAVRMILENHPSPHSEAEIATVQRLVREGLQGLEQALADAGVPMPQDESAVEQPAEPVRPAGSKPKRARTPAQPVPRASH